MGERNKIREFINFLPEKKESSGGTIVKGEISIRKKKRKRPIGTSVVLRIGIHNGKI